MRRGFLVAAALAVEGYLYWRYAVRGALFHFWLHGLFGAALVGLAAVTTVVAVAVRAPIPQTLDEVREPPRVVLLCPLAGPGDDGRGSDR